MDFCRAGPIGTSYAPISVMHASEIAIEGSARHGLDSPHAHWLHRPGRCGCRLRDRRPSARATSRRGLPGIALKGLSWRLIGPAMVAGRVADVVGVPGNPDLLYVGTASWGLYESTNGGTTFDPVFETGNTLSIGAIAVQPDRPDVIYVGTGEGAVRNSISFGDGIYKSTDGGRSWAHLGLRETERGGGRDGACVDRFFCSLPALKKAGSSPTSTAGEVDGGVLQDVASPSRIGRVVSVMLPRAA
jgi:hypothetical protein